MSSKNRVLDSIGLGVKASRILMYMVNGGVVLAGDRKIYLDSQDFRFVEECHGENYMVCGETLSFFMNEIVSSIDEQEYIRISSYNAIHCHIQSRRQGN